MRRVLRVGCLVLVAATIACGGEDTDDRANLTQREKDSIVAGSQLPGARGVKRAMTSADSAAARQARLDSADKEP